MIKVIENVHYDVDRARAEFAETLDRAGFTAATRSILSAREYSVSRLVDRPDIAAMVGAGSFRVKDESSRLGQHSFKALGGTYAVQRAYARWAEAGHVLQSPDDFTVTCVTDGNHGYAVAQAARDIGCRAVIYVPSIVSPARVEALTALGAEVVQVDGNYDEVSEKHRRDASAKGWRVITDTVSEAEVPQCVLDVMQGYRVMAQELVDDFAGSPPTHVFLQAGCGGMAAAVLGHLSLELPPERFPQFVVVEPANAACLQRSAENGEPVRVHGTLETLMNGLSVGEVSTPAWPILKHGVKYFASMDDSTVPLAMQALNDGTPSLQGGETGAAGVAAAIAISQDEQTRQKCHLSEEAHVVTILTEGPTDPESFARLTQASEALGEVDAS